MSPVLKKCKHKAGGYWRYVKRQLLAKKSWQRSFVGGYCALLAIYLLAATHVSIATGSWTQTDWSGGSGSSTTNQYASASNLTTASAGKVTLDSSEKLNNTGFELDETNWNSNYSYATPVVVQSKFNRTASNVSTLSVTLDSTPVSGNTLFVLWSIVGSPGTVTPPSGFTQDADLSNSTGGNQRLFIWRKTAQSNESATITVNITGSQVQHLTVIEASGISTSSPLDQLANSSSTSTTSLTNTPTTSTTTQAKELAIGAVGLNGLSSTFTSWGNDFTATPVLGSNPSLFTGTQVLSSTQQLSLSASWSTARAAISAIATYKAAPIITATHETTTKHSGNGAVKLIASSAGDGIFAQNTTVGNTNNGLLTAYAYTNGSAVTSADAELAVNGSPISTTYESVGSGWYKLSGTTAASASQVSYGLQVKSSKTVYLDDVSFLQYSSSGTLTSNIYDTGTISNWGNLTYTTSGAGTIQVRVRSSNSATMAGAPSFSSCVAVASGSDLSSGTGGCVADVERYIQYEVTLVATTTAETPSFEDITIDFTDADNTPPITNAHDLHMYKENGGTEVSEGEWNNSPTPYFTWDAGEDNADGSGIKGYCLYLGQDETADPLTTKGLLGDSPVDTEGACQFTVNTSAVDLSTVDYLSQQIPSSEDSYYLVIKAIDNVNNVYSGSAATFEFKHDVDAPSNPAFISAPSNFISTKSTTLTWPTSGGDAASDSHSGIAGLQYRIGSNGTWYGDSHSGDQNSSDLLSNDGSYSTQSTPDFANLTDGNNVIYFRTWDQAGNVTTATVTTVLKINTSGAPSSPRNLIATPSSNSQNSFAFSWIAPASFVGQSGNLTYCYTVNTQPTEQTCSFTASGVTSVSAGAFATQPGANTFYVVAKDESGSINYDTASSVTFTANTSAPGMPLNVDIADTSVKASNNWRLVISWEEPEDTGAGVAKYQIYRSTDNSNFSLAGSTSGSSYVDTGLQSRVYYYKIKACDSANNCGAFSATESKTPTGRFTTPPNLEGTPRVSSLGTRSATVNWETDRNADSKVAFGTKSGNYFSTEAYNSTATGNHSVELTNLNPGTTYYYIAKWTDEDGNTGQSAELAFTTLPPPSVEDVSVPVVNLTFATLQYTTTGAHKVKIYYGKSSGFGGTVNLNTSVNKSVYSSSLSDLEDGTKYFYKINTFDADGNEYEGTTLTFTTPPAPKISNLRFQPIENEPSSSQKVTWDTNVAGSSELSYGTSGLTESALNSALTTKHELIIRGLKDDSSYRLIARSRDGSGNLATSDEQTFKTALDTRPPQVSDVIIDTSIKGTGAEARGQIVVSWRTDEPATSQAAFGAGSGTLSNTTTEDARLTYEHIVVISDLSTSQVYYVEPRSYDKGRNLSSGEQQVAIVGRASDNVLGIIVNALQQLFGVN